MRMRVSPEQRKAHRGGAAVQHEEGAIGLPNQPEEFSVPLPLLPC